MCVCVCVCVCVCTVALRVRHDLTLDFFFSGAVLLLTHVVVMQSHKTTFPWQPAGIPLQAPVSPGPSAVTLVPKISSSVSLSSAKW